MGDGDLHGSAVAEPGVSAEEATAHGSASAIAGQDMDPASMKHTIDDGFKREEVGKREDVQELQYAYSESSRGRKRKQRIIDDQQSGDRNVKKREKKSDKRNVEDITKTKWICVECREAECELDPSAQELLMCEGPCSRLFHHPCVNLKAVPPDDVPFYCLDCTERRHRCAVCQDYGEDNIDVFKCKRDGCGFFFHEGCLILRNIDFTYQDVKKLQSNGGSEDIDKDDEFVSTGPPLFDCPAHRCWTCAYSEDGNELRRVMTEGKKKTKKPRTLETKSGELICCIECPLSYHVTCIPPTARFHELALLCHEHAATCKLPHLDKESSIQNAIESEVDKKLLDAEKKKRLPKVPRSGRNPFFFAQLGEQSAEDEASFIEKVSEYSGETFNTFFCLPTSIKNEVYALLPTYRHIQVNKVDPNHAPPRFPIEESCFCKNACGFDCFNRAIYVECTPKNCKVGPSCGNRMIGQRQVPKCKVKREQGKGWGLITTQKISKGHLAQEYIGEIIDEQEKVKRLTEWSKIHPNDPNYYIMENSPGWFIDARFTSNLSRFINHSCDPNCVLTVFNVNGVKRNGIFALRDIEAGEFLSYDYNFDCKNHDQFRCRCGAKSCRGTLQYGNQRKEDNQTKTKSQLWEEANAIYERDKKYVREYFQDANLRRSQVSAFVPEGISNDELVANGPQRQKYRKEALAGRIFLWRNVVLGSDFIARSLRLPGDEGEPRRNGNK